MVRAKLIRQGGELLAKAFLDHEQMRKRKQARAEQRALSSSPFPPERNDIQRKEWTSLEDELRDHHGQTFFGDYGWAHELMREISPAYKEEAESGRRERGPRFDDVESAVDEFSSQIPYGEACFAVHGSAASALEDGLVADIRRGPSPHLIGWVEVSINGARRAHKGLREP